MWCFTGNSVWSHLNTLDTVDTPVAPDGVWVVVAVVLRPPHPRLLPAPPQPGQGGQPRRPQLLDGGGGAVVAGVVQDVLQTPGLPTQSLPLVVSLLDRPDALTAHFALRAPVAPHGVRGLPADDAQRGHGPLDGVVHFYDDFCLLIFDVELVYNDPGKNEEDAGQDWYQWQDGVGHTSLLQQEEEMNDEVEARANGAEDGEHVPDQPGQEELRPGSDHSYREEEGGDQAQQAHTEEDHQQDHHQVGLLLGQRAEIIVVDVAQTVHLHDSSLDLVDLVGMKDPAEDWGPDGEEVGGGEGDVESDDCGVEGGTTPGVPASLATTAHLLSPTAQTQLTTNWPALPCRHQQHQSGRVRPSQSHFFSELSLTTSTSTS